jgi:hypothetical protein
MKANKCNRCGKKMPDDDSDNICTECALKEWEKILSDDED